MEDVRDELGLCTTFDEHSQLGLVVLCAWIGVGVEGYFYFGDLLAGCGQLGFYAGLDCVLVMGEDVGYGPAGGVLVQLKVVCWVKSQVWP